MKGIVKLNTLTTSLLVVAASPMGQVMIILLLTVFDAGLNMWAISSMFKDRIEMMEGIGNAKNIAVSFSVIAPICIGAGIFATSLLPKRKFDYQTKDSSKATYESHPASTKMAWLSFFISFVGFQFVIIPESASTWESLSKPYFWMEETFALLLSGVSPYLISVFSKSIAKNFGAIFTAFIGSIIEKTKASMMAELNDITEKNAKKRDGNFEIIRPKKIA